jgi:hypothetical protein
MRGFPDKEVHSTDSQGVSTFTFSPWDNLYFQVNRFTEWTTGSLLANDYIAFEITAELQRDGVTLRSRLSEEEPTLGKLQQDELDILRQEYVDYKMNIPARADVTPAKGSMFNWGNYSYVLGLDGMESHYDSLLDRYRHSKVVVNGSSVDMPANASVSITLAYINPQRRNKLDPGYLHSIHHGQGYPFHMYGRALDLAAVPVKVLTGPRTQVSLHSSLFPDLEAAARSLGTAWCDSGAEEVDSSDLSENHVHFQW